VADGHWKTAYPICMYTGSALTEDYLPNVCTSSPVPGIYIVRVRKVIIPPTSQGKAFCIEHAKLLEQNKYPTGLREFIKFCGCDPNKYTKYVFG
jgi:hypothetical protein